MNVLSLQNVVKAYHNHIAVNDVSFDVKAGSIFGLLGPNGAGKTSMIRIITTITAADSGRVLINGQPLNALHPNEIGYMPEERGLYKKMKVGEQLVYLAQLKGLSQRDAKNKVKFWLEKFDILSWWNKDVGELSKGMSQKAQFIATIVHEPSLIILDEPFSGLDPINANLIKDEIYALQQNGTSILFSTHRMEQVEEICEDIVLINKGSNLSQQGYEIINHKPGEIILKSAIGHSPNQLLKSLLDENISIIGFNEILPSLNEIFIKKVASNNE
jgi:ABC-2 type transport system ATP-binding protein